MTMSRNNSWQNNQLAAELKALSNDELTRDRGAFFGSLLRTASHLLWGDLMWLARFDGGESPGGGFDTSVTLVTSLTDWESARLTTDHRIAEWANALKENALAGDLSWYSGALGKDVTKPLAFCVAHMFNHQTHHRGQIHAMLTNAGAPAPVSDLFLMPEDASA